MKDLIKKLEGLKAEIVSAINMCKSEYGEGADEKEESPADYEDGGSGPDKIEMAAAAIKNGLGK